MDKTGTTDNHFDVLIAGAGPGGTTCALALKGAGLKVAMIDKANFPRDKICGDAIPGRTVKVLSALDPNYLARLDIYGPKTHVYSARFISSIQQEASITWKTPAYNCTRLEFDHFLLNLALEETGVHFFPETHISSAEIGPEQVCLHTSKGHFYGKILVGCDGSPSLLARKLAGFTVDKSHYCGAVRAYYEGIAGMQTGVNEVFFSRKFRPGYFWIFPVNATQANVGFGMLSSIISKRKISLTSAFFQVIEEFPELQARFEQAILLSKPVGFGLPLGTRALNISGQRFLLCGDAASLIDPVSGTGIGNCMLSAKLAAEHIIRHIGADRFSEKDNKAYDRSVYAAIGKELRTNTRVLRWSSRFPVIPDLGIFLLSKKNPLSFVFRKLI